AAVFAGAPAAVVYALAVVTALASTAFGPAQSALLPALARSPEELTAANATSTSLESIGFFLGPALGGLLLAVTSAGAVFSATAALFLWSALVLGRVSADSRGDPSAEVESIGREALAGFRAILGEHRLRLVVGLYGAQTLIAGLMRVLADVAGLTLLQRTAPDKVRARVFGVFESVFLATIGIGAIVAPLLMSAFGPRGALIAAGGGLSVVVLLFWRRLGTVDAPALVP